MAPSWSRAPRPLGALLLAVGLALLTACPGIKNVNPFTQHITLQPLAGGSYSGYSRTTFGQRIPAGKKLYLRSATITSSTGEFTWATSLTGAASPDAGAQVLVSKPSFEGAERTTELDVVDTGDILPLYPDQDFRVYWSLQYASTLTQAYPDGVTLDVTYELEMD